MSSQTKQGKKKERNLTNSNATSLRHVLFS